MSSKEVITALETLHKELERLKPAIKHVEMAQLVTEMVESIPGKHLELLKEIKSDDLKYKEDLKDHFTKELISITEENKKISKITGDIQDQVKLEQESLAKLKDSVKSYSDRVEKINFPERLDKLDANVAGIMAAIQSVQSRLDSLERNVVDRLRDLSDYQKETRVGTQNILAALQTKISSSSKRQQIFTFISWGLILVIAIIIYLTKS